MPSLSLLAVLAVALYVAPLLFGVPLTDPDEGLHAAIALEMVERGDWVVPRLFGEPFLDKPILFFAAQAASIGMLGATEFAVRLPGQLFGFLGAVTTGLLAGFLAGRPHGLAAACIYATLAFPMALNQVAVHDVALVPWINLAMLCLLAAVRREGFALWLYVVAGGWLGLAILTKGLVGVALVGLPLAAIVVLERRLSVRAIAGGLVTVVLALLVALPWYLAVERAEPGYLRYFFVERHLLGFTTTTQIHGWRPWWYYLPVLVGGSLPWVVCLFARQPADTRLDPATALRRFAWAWLVLDLGFLSTAGSKLATYILPLYPAVACLVADRWCAGGERGTSHLASQPRWIVLTTALAGALVMPVATWFVVSQWQTSINPLAWLTVAVLTAAWAAVVSLGPRWTSPRPFATIVTLLVATLLASYAAWFRHVANGLSARDLAAYFDSVHYFPPRLWIVDERVGSLIFYLDPALRRDLEPDRVQGVTLGQALLGSATTDTLIAVPESVVPRLANRLDLQPVGFYQAGRYRIYESASLRTARPRSVDGQPVR